MIQSPACSCNAHSQCLGRSDIAEGKLPSSSETSSMDVTDNLWDVRLGELGASSLEGWVAVSAGVVCVFCSSATGMGSLCSRAPSTLGIPGMSGTSSSAVCSAEAEDSRRLISEREREEVGRGVVSAASANESCGKWPGQRLLRRRRHAASGLLTESPLELRALSGRAAGFVSSMVWWAAVLAGGRAVNLSSQGAGAGTMAALGAACMRG